MLLSRALLVYDRRRAIRPNRCPTFVAFLSRSSIAPQRYDNAASFLTRALNVDGVRHFLRGDFP